MTIPVLYLVLEKLRCPKIYLLIGMYAHTYTPPPNTHTHTAPRENVKVKKFSKFSAPFIKEKEQWLM